MLLWVFECLCVIFGVGLIYVLLGGVVYGEVGMVLVSEDSVCYLVLVYGISKFIVERYVVMYVRVYGVLLCIMRVVNVYWCWVFDS